MSEPFRLNISVERSAEGAWKIACGEATCEVVPHGDPFGATVLQMPKCGEEIHRKLAESTALTLLGEGWLLDRPGPFRFDF